MLLSDLPALSTGLLLSGEETGHSAELRNAAVPGRKGWVQIQLTAWCVQAQGIAVAFGASANLPGGCYKPFQT